MKSTRVIWALGCLAMSCVQAQGRTEQPTRGVKYAEDKPVSMFYECRSTAPGAIRCKLTELNVWKPHYRASVEERYPLVFRNSRAPAECARAEGLLASDTSTPSGRANREWAEVMHEACTTGDAERLRQWARNQHERLQRTCMFDAHSFEQTFRRVDSGDPRKIVWSIAEKPAGECGILREARFVGTVREELPYIDWDYRIEWRATNKAAQQGTMQCSILKDREETFSAEARPESVECETVYFSNGCDSPDFPCMGDGPRALD